MFASKPVGLPVMFKYQNQVFYSAQFINIPTWTIQKMKDTKPVSQNRFWIDGLIIFYILDLSSSFWLMAWKTDLGQSELSPVPWAKGLGLDWFYYLLIDTQYTNKSII